MRFVLTILFSVLISTQANAEVESFETRLPITCGDTTNLIEGLKGAYGEEVLVMAADKTPDGNDLFHSLWVNYSTKTWTFIAVNKQKGVTCVIASGNNLNVFFPTGI